ncbi:MAG: hypothetical protein M5U28_22505 [Sandaracinaceae bacterium]|nr:hypothetical protein [Sandaracinaceae bacterium]
MYESGHDTGARGAREDEYEARHMRGDGEVVLHRDKRVSRWLAAAAGSAGLFTLALAVVIGVMNGTAERPLPPIALPFVLGAVALLGLLIMAVGVVYGVLRTVVTDREVRVQLGDIGPRIPLDRIVSCTVVDYEWTRYGGFGARIGRDGSWAYVPGPGKAVEIRYTDDGEEKRVLVGAGDPHETARQIDKARARAASAHERRYRVAIDEEGGEPLEEHLEAPTDRDRARPERAKKAR